MECYNAHKVCLEFTPRLRTALEQSGYPESVVETATIKYNADKHFFYVEIEDTETFEAYEYGDGERPPTGAVRNFFLHFTNMMLARLDQLLEESYAVFI